MPRARRTDPTPDAETTEPGTPPVDADTPTDETDSAATPLGEAGEVDQLADLARGAATPDVVQTTHDTSDVDPTGSVTIRAFSPMPGGPTVTITPQGRRGRVHSQYLTMEAAREAADYLAERHRDRGGVAVRVDG